MEPLGIVNRRRGLVFLPFQTQLPNPSSILARNEPFRPNLSMCSVVTLGGFRVEAGGRMTGLEAELVTLAGDFINHTSQQNLHKNLSSGVR